MHEIKRIRERHHRIIDLALAGMSNKGIGDVLGVTPESVGMILKSPLVQEEIARRRRKESGELSDQIQGIVKRAEERVLKTSERAAEVQEELLEDDDAGIRFRASQSILDRALGPSGKGSDGSASGVTINTENVQLLVTALKETGYGQTSEPIEEREALRETADGTAPEGPVDEYPDVRQTSDTADGG